MNKLSYNGPIVLAIMDGIGLGKRPTGNAVAQARTPFLNHAIENYLALSLEASGTAVGAMPGDMGNSEIGHNAIGAGQVIKQGIAKVEDAFQTGDIWKSRAWKGIIQNHKQHPDSTLHFAGIFSDGNIHSNIEHLEKMILRARRDGIDKIRVHLVLDGRDVAPQSEPKYIKRLEKFFQRFPDADYKIASGAGRMVAVADRYQSDWGMVEKGWKMMVHGEADHHFKSATEAIEYFRRQDPDLQDQYIPPFVIDNAGNLPIGRVEPGDAFIYFDFRADRAIEIAMAMTYNDFPYFDRSPESASHSTSSGNTRPDIFFAGMTEYNSDTHVPEFTLVPPVEIHDTLPQFLGSRGISQYAISETVKYGHITYYFNGNSYEQAPGEVYQEIVSSTQPFDTRPWMASAEITDAVLENLHKYQFVRVNFPNGDMVGHFADLAATKLAVEAVDMALGRIAKEVDALGGMMLITADHGNAEEITGIGGEPKSSHTTNKVPCIFYDNTENRLNYASAHLEDASLTNLASTIALLLGQNDYPAVWRQPLIELV